MGADNAAAKRARLLQQLRDGKAPLAAAPLLAPEPGARVPLTRGQEQMWLDCQLAPDEPVYNEAVTLRRTGPCDVAALRRAFNLALSRHEAWRTTFASEDGQAYQLVRSHADHPLPLVDLSSLHAEREAEATKLATADARAPFDLENGPLFRPLLVRLSEQDHRLYLTLHHLVFDGVALRLLVSEMLEIYRALVAGCPLVLPSPPPPHSHYACWERQSLTAAVLEPRLAFWRGCLREATPVEPPADRPHPGHRTRNGAGERTFVDRAVIDRLKALARQEGATLFLVLLTAYAVLLHRYSGQQDLVIAALVDGRRHRELEKLMGFMINPLPVRIDVTGDPSFAELLGRVRETFLTGLANEVPFGELLRALRPARDASSNPIFQAMFSLDPPLPPLGEGWELDEVDVEVSAAKCDLQLFQDERDEGTVGRFVYSTDLFEADTWKRLAECWGVLLEGIATDARCRVSALPFLTDAQRTTLLDEWNRTEAPYPATSRIHELFQEQARVQPDAVAVVHGERQLTYGQLDAWADQLAGRLRDLGVGPHLLVGVCAERSPEMVVAVLGILKAGGAYVPLDPAYPIERLAFIVDDAGIRALVSQTHLLSRLPATDAVTVCVDDLGAAPVVGANGGVSAGPDGLAYVFYTSGSTGAPKGVMIEHRGVVNHIAALIRDYGLGPADTVVQLPSLSFHPSVRDIFATLSAGARLVLLDEVEARDPVKIVEVIAHERVTCALSFVPSLLNAVLESPRTDDLPDIGLRLILTCGEGLREQDARRARERFGCVVANQFGPTETIMACSKHTTGPGDPPGAMVPAGKAEANARLYVVDRYGGLAPIGAPGELLVGGLGLARGYLNRPELTAERFGADPFCAAPGARVHRTGDLVRYRGDGSLEFLGRVDDQVKIRGHRVELGEVEAALARCGGVKQAGVAVQTDAGGDCRLLGVIVSDHGGAPLDTSAVRSRLERALPAHMVPAAIVMVDELPLTPSGKLDRLALARMKVDGSRGVAGHELPAPGMEAALAEIWADALGRDRIGRHDNFFDLGGHSLMAARLIGTIERRLGLRLPLAAFFGDGVTVAGLAEAIAALGVDSTRDGDGRLLVPMRPGTLPALFCVYPNDASLLAARHLLPVLEPGRAVFGLRPPLDGWSGGVRGAADPLSQQGRDARRRVRPSSVEELAQPLLQLLLRVQPTGPYLITGYSFGGIVAYELAGRLADLGHRVAFLGLVDIMTPQLWARHLKPRLGHLVRGRRRTTTAVRLVAIRRRQARVALARVGLREPLPPRPEGFSYLERMRVLGCRYRTDGLDCPLVVFHTEASLAITGKASLGWEGLHRGPIEAVSVPGDHRTLWIEPNVTTLATAVAARVRSAAASEAVPDGHAGLEPPRPSSPGSRC